MAGSLTTEQLEYVHNNTTERSINWSSDPGTGTSRNFTFPKWMCVLTLLIALLGLVGNGLVLWLVGFHIQRNRFFVYILNLAAADALFLCCTFLIFFHIFVQYLSLNSMYLVVLYLRSIFYIVGLSLLAAISTERCLSVLFPLWYRCHLPKHTSTGMCAVLWALGALLMAVRSVACFVVYHDPFCFKVFFFIQTGCFTLLTCVLCVSSLTLLLRVQCTSQRRQPPRLYRLVLLTVLVFLFCGLPMAIWDFIDPFHIRFKLYWLPDLLVCVSSSANPFIYFFLGRQRHKKRRETLRVIFQRALGEEQELGDGEGNTPHTNSQETTA